MLTRKRMLALAGAGLVAGAASFAQAADTDLRGELEALKAEVATLRSQQNENWLNTRRSAEVKALVKEVLADADTRASLLEGGLTAGHNGKNFFLASEDGSFLLKVKGQIQFRYVANFQNDDDDVLTLPNTADTDEANTGFVVRRAKLSFSGHVASPKLGYEIQLSIDRGDNQALADKIKISYQINDCWSIWFGEDKAPFLREELVSSSKQLAVERSYVNEIFTLDRVQGVALDYNSDMLRASFMISDGMRSGDGSGSSNPFTQSDEFLAQVPGRNISKDFDEDASDIALTARVDLKLAGNWEQWDDFTAWEGEDTAVFVGAAIHWEEGESGETSFDNNSFLMWTVDAAIEIQRFNAFVALNGMHTDVERQAAATAQDYDIYGLVAQAGYQIPFNGEIVEPFIRYEWIDFDNAISSALPAPNTDNRVHMITVGGNYYFNKHSAKFTLDVVHAFDSLYIPSTGLGLLADGFQQEGQTVVRAQFQLLF